MESSLCMYIVMFLAGIGWGFLALPSILYALDAVLPRFREIQELTKLETSHLLHIILRSPLLWLALTGVWSLAVVQFLRPSASAYFFGLGISLCVVALNFCSGRDRQQRDLIAALKKKILTPLMDPAEKFAPYSPRQMRMSNWRPAQYGLNGFSYLTFQCATCYHKRGLANAKVCFRGNGRRYIVACDRCGQPSIIRVAGSILSEYRVITEARLPEHRATAAGKSEERPDVRAPTTRAP